MSKHISKKTQKQLNIPVISQEQSWERNQRFKNWGNYTPLFFKQGKPKLILPRVSICFYFFLLQMIFLWIIISDAFKKEGFDLYMGARSLLLIIGSACFYKLLSIDPGIKSNGAPIINLPEVSQYHNFCTECKCNQSPETLHCSFCRVCIKSSYAHLPISSLCLTPSNLSMFLALCLTTIGQSFILIF